MGIAILLDKNDKRFATYTENDDIPVGEVQAAGRVYLCRVPVPDEKANEKVIHGRYSQPLHEILEAMTSPERRMFYESMIHVLPYLHTQDVKTALAIIDTDSFEETRKILKREMIVYLATNMNIFLDH